MPNTSATGGPLLPLAADPEDTGAVLQRLVVALTGLPGKMVRPRWQPNEAGTPNPDVDWCAVGVTEETPDAYGAMTHDPGDGTSAKPARDVMHRHAAVEALASFYGPNGRANAARLRDGLLVGQNRAPLRAAGLNLAAVGATRRSPDQVNTRWVDRWDLPIALRRVTSRAYAVETVAEAPLTLTPDATASHD